MQRRGARPEALGLPLVQPVQRQLQQLQPVEGGGGGGKRIKAEDRNNLLKRPPRRGMLGAERLRFKWEVSALTSC